MVKGFGLTWWGERWLHSLRGIDYENRLPRGASYARSGHVDDLSIDKNIITAWVIGTRYRPYSVEIRFPLFTKKEIKSLIDAIVQQPILVSNLINRNLDSKILDIADRLDLKVFPDSWNDLEMVCNCPDRAVPCKHIAAVIYAVSREIDNNPFLIFKLRGIDLLEELKARGISGAASLKVDIPYTADRFVKSRLNVLNIRKKQIIAEPVHSLNYTGIKPIGEAIYNTLPALPPFYHKGDFKEIYSKDMTRVAKGAAKVLSAMSLGAYAGSETPTPVDRDVNWNLVLNDYMELTVDGVLLDTQKAKAFMSSLLSLPYELVLDYMPAVAAMRHALLTALHLLKNGAVRPVISRRPTDNYAIDWVPVSIDINVKALMDKLEPLFPKGSLQVRFTDEDHLSAIKNQGEMAVVFFLNVLVSVLSKDTHCEGDVIRSLFLHQTEYDFLKVGENEVPGSIAAWLGKLDVVWRHYLPVFEVNEENEDGTLFSVQINLIDKQHPRRKPVPVSEVLSKRRKSSTHFEFIQEISALSSLVDGLSDYIDDGALTPMFMDVEKFTRFLIKSIPAIRFLGAKVVLPDSLRTLLRPRPSMTILRKGRSANLSYLNLDSLLTFNWKVALGDELMSLAELNRLIERNSGLIKYKAGYVYVSDTDLQELQNIFRERKPLTGVQMLHTALSGEYEGAKVTLTDEVVGIIKELTSPQLEKLPDGLTAEMRPYQERGYSWMWRNMRVGFGSIIADDMGLGKTLQVITLLLRLKQEGALEKKKALVVAPAGLLTNWQAEIEKFAPSLSSFIYHGPQRAVWDFKHDVFITSYGVMRSDLVALKNMKWRVMVIDEAQNIKNSATAQSVAVRSIPADAHIAMSGTPVENRLSEYWTIMDFVNKGYLGTAKSFQKEFARPIQTDGDPIVAERFRKITSPLMIRRMKTDKSIISDLPEKIERNYYAALTPRQVALYQSVLNDAMHEIEGIEATDNRSMFKRQGLVLQMILALKQICNHPSQFTKGADWSPALSGKVEMLLNLLDTIVESGEKVLVFTQFREMGEILRNIVEQRYRRAPMFYHGGTSLKDRQVMIKAFQNDPRKQIFILSLRAAGTGLNLTAASHVIHFDLWWNPAVENQATDRAYRIGQDKNVMVHRLITRNTFEEKIDDMINRKKELAELTVAAGENWIGRLSNKELHDIFDRR